MTSGCAIFPWKCATAPNWQRLKLCLALSVLGILLATPLSATVNSGEIIQNSVSATIGTTYDPVNGVSVTFQWQTVHPGNSIVVIENDLDYQGNDNSSSRQIVQNDYVYNHVVVVDHFPAYSINPTWGYYVASQVNYGRCNNAKQAVCPVWATYPGPPVPGCNQSSPPYCYLPLPAPPLAYPTSPTNPSGTLVFSMWPVGGQNVYQGDPTQSPACSPTSKSSRECNDLYVATQTNLLSGSSQAIVLMQSPQITNLDTGQIVTDNSITAQFLCDLDAPSNPPPSGWDGDYNSSNEACSNGAVYTTNTTVRLRVNSQAVPGHYQFMASFQGQLNGQNSGSATQMTYNFTVLPTASFTPTPPTTFPTIAGITTWQSNMINWSAPAGTDNADFWCTNVTDTDPWWSLDNGNFSGWMDVPAGIYFEAWNYDGGRVYQQAMDYDNEYYNDPSHNTEWHRCSQLAMEPYKDTVIGTNGGMVQEPNQFAFGLAMNYMRTGDPTYQDAVNLLAFNPAYYYWFSGSVYAESVRVSAYMMDDRLANEIIGAQRDTAFTLRAVDVMLGYLDQSYNLSLSNPNQQEYNIHPFMVGLAMEALITYYELDLAEGNTPDARIPLEIRKVLDWWQATQYVSSQHTLAYGAYDVPPRDPQLVPGTLYSATELNDLVATAYAWYWYKTNNTTYLNEGDDLFSHVWKSAGGQTLGGNGGWTWSVKEYNQVYKWSFDYVRWRSGANPDGSQPPVETVLASQNPYSGPLTDYTTPVQFFWTPAQNGQVAAIDPKLSDSPNTVTVTATTATISLNVFKPNTTMQVWYGTAAPPNCNSEDPAPPYCMQPFPDFGFLQMLNASYPYQSTITTAVPDPIALSQGIPNIYDETLTITGLSPNTTYHWRPLTTDSLNNMAAYSDETFTTLGQ